MKMAMFHNPKCSKSRETLKLLNDKGIHPEIILYIKNPPTEGELKTLVQKLGIPPKALVRFKEATASEWGLAVSDTRPDAEWIKRMCEHPILIERPIVITPTKAVIGRPPERVLSLIEK